MTAVATRTITSIVVFAVAFLIGRAQVRATR